MSKTDALNKLFGDRIDEAFGKRTNTAKLVPLRRPPEAELVEAKDGDYPTIPIGQIVVGEQHRKTFDERTIAEMADSIQSVGLIEPIVVRPNTEQQTFELVAGERRLRAAKLLGLEDIPSRIMRLTDAEAAEVQLVENVLREELNPIEEALAFQSTMQKTGRNASELAKRIGIHRATVTRALRLLRLPNDVQHDVVAGKLSAGVAREVARVSDEPTQRDLLTRVEKESLTVGETEKIVQGLIGPKKKPQRVIKSSRSRRSTRRRLTFPTEHATVVVTCADVATYHHIAEALSEAHTEVQRRIEGRGPSL